MTTPAFDHALAFVLRWEGGLVDHPNDPGGRTSKGVTQKVYDRWRQRQGLPGRDVKEIDDAEMHAIYASDYWLPPRCDLLRSPLDLVQFDTAVNMGTARAVRILQATLACGADGDFGPGTERAAAECDVATAVVAYCQQREDFYRRLVVRDPKLDVFMKGWMNRLNALRNRAGLPGFEAADRLDFGDTGYIAKVPGSDAEPGEDAGASADAVSDR